MMKVLATLALAAVASASESPDTWDAATAGKTIMVKFQAPWCGHCKRMKPAWDKLMKEYAGHDSAAVVDVDCTAAGKPLCDANGVRGFPTIKWGSPDALEAYEGGRDFDSLLKFANENLKPTCSPANIELCDAEKTAEIEKYSTMSDADLAAAIKEGDEKMEAAEKTFKDEVSKLQSTYEALMKAKDEAVEAVKDSGLGMMKSIAAHKKKAAKEEL